MKHKYIKNFKHLINLINNVIDNLTTEQIIEINEQGGVGNAQFYYDYVYQYEYCDAFAYAITKVSPVSLASKQVIVDNNFYLTKGFAYGKKWKKNNKNWIEIPNELKNK